MRFSLELKWPLDLFWSGLTLFFIWHQCRWQWPIPRGLFWKHWSLTDLAPLAVKDHLGAVLWNGLVTFKLLASCGSQRPLFFLTPQVWRQVRTAVVLLEEFLFREKPVHFWNKMSRGAPSLKGLFLDQWKSFWVFFLEWSIQSRCVLLSVLSTYVLGKGNMEHTKLTLTDLMDKSQKGERG